MPVAHKHAAVIKAWADGAAVEYRTRSNLPWKLTGSRPAWNPEYQYRAVPPKIRFRLLIRQLGSSGRLVVSGVNDKTAERLAETHPTFVRWLGEWQEIEA